MKISKSAQNKLDAIASVFRRFHSQGEQVRSFDTVIARSGLSKTAVMSLMRKSEYREALQAMLNNTVVFRYYASAGYQASGNGAFGHYRCNDRRGHYSSAKVFVDYAI